MGKIFIDHIDETIIQRLEHSAKAKNTSLEEEIREILTQAAKPNWASFVDKATRFRDAIQKRGIPISDSVDLIRED